MSELRFPEGFIWGAATAAYQVEGYPDADGKGPSIWDTFVRRSGAIRHGDTGDRACEHYVRYPEDLDLAAELGLTSYRFSISWPRVQPDGKGRVNPAGLDHYRRVVAACHDRGIAPAVTLYHWDLPQALEDEGGWSSRDTAYRFADYAGAVVDALGESVPHWITVNEPAVAAGLGYLGGDHAPGARDPERYLPAAHHLLLGHGLAVERLRSTAPGAQVGISLSHWPTEPASEAAEDRAAALLRDGHTNRMFFDPVLRGQYPADLVEHYGPERFDVVQDGDLRTISTALDFLGLNYYSVLVVAARVRPEERWPHLGSVAVPQPGRRMDAMGWADVPEGLRGLLGKLREDFPGIPPILITENGAAWDDYRDPTGAVRDLERIDYLDGHLRAVSDAIRAGVDVRGYFAWSLLDNFEWAHGYGRRFGLVHVDYPTQLRTPKESYRWLQRVIASAASPREADAQS